MSQEIFVIEELVKELVLRLIDEKFSTPGPGYILKARPMSTTTSTVS